MGDMSDTTEGAPQGASEPTPAPQPATTTDTAPDTGTEQTPQPSASEPTPDQPAEKKTPWFQKRIDDLTREKWEARRQAETLQAALDAMRSGQSQPATEGPQQPTQPLPDIEKLVSDRAQKLREREAFDEACNRTYEAGKSAYQDFDTAVEGYRMLGGLQDKPAFLEAVTALPNGADVFYHLGKNLDDAARVLSLPPVKMAVELAKISASAAKPKPVSSAPPPINPVGGSSSNPTGDPTKMSMKEWVKWREKQLSR